MNHLRSWWRWWQDSEAEIDRSAGHDERYRRIEGDALRIAARTLPITILLLLVAGRLWLPETVGRTDILRLAAVAGLVVLGVFWLTVRGVRERRGAFLSDPAMPPGRALMQHGASLLGAIALILLSRWILGMPNTWGAVAGVITAYAIWSLVNVRRWRREQGRVRAG